MNKLMYMHHMHFIWLWDCEWSDSYVLPTPHWGRHIKFSHMSAIHLWCSSDRPLT